MTTLLAPAVIEIGDPGACENNDCCGSILLALLDWHDAKSSERAIVIRGVIGVVKYLKVFSPFNAVGCIEGINY